MEEVEAEEQQQYSHRQVCNREDERQLSRLEQTKLPRAMVRKIRVLFPTLPERLPLKAAVHYTVGCLCQEVELDKQVHLSKQTIAAISEVTFRQCENFAKDLEMFARHAKRSTITTDDVKLLSRRSNSLLRYITEKNKEIAQLSLERKAKKKRKPEDEDRSSREPGTEELGDES